jgi:DHA3 family multidrug efflux protein-like MFS transporter
MRTFHKLLVNSLLSGVTSTFLWFSVTFWVYLETRSVVATSIIGGAFSASSALLGIVFGTFVDRHRKKSIMLSATSASLGCYLFATMVYVLVDRDQLLRLGNVAFWLFVFSILAGSVVGNMRSIALSTCVTLLVDEPQRARANGMVGSVMGVSFAITSVFSGLVVGGLGMGWALAAALVVTAAAAAHLLTIRIHEPASPLAHDAAAGAVDGPRWIDVRGALDAIAATPGLMALILFASFNNLLGGVFMALMDAYGLSLISVEAWGLLWGALSLGFIVGGLVVARRGLGQNPLRIVIVGNLVNWTICSIFTLRSSILALAIGMFIWLCLIPVIEAAEQTVLQRAVPYERQGRVFGFAQTVEHAASPLTAFLIGPIAEVVFIPFMTTGRGVDLIGGWFGTGTERGLALIFTLAGLIGLFVTARAWTSKSYRALTATLSTPAA